MKNQSQKEVLRSEAEYWDKFEKEAQEYGIPIWVDYQKANTPEIPFINFSTDPEIDRLYLGELKDSVIRKAGKGRILDLGCGAGWLCLELARRGAKAEGIDISSQRIKIAREYARKEKVSIEYSVGNIEDCNWAKKEKYNAILNWNSLHHVEDVERLLRCIHKALKRDGLFISWDHLGDNFLISFATKIATLIPGYYKDKRTVLGTIHSEAEGIAKVRLHKEVVERVFEVDEYQSRFIFVHLLPPVYKFIKYKLHMPFPKIIFKIVMKISFEVDRVLSSLFPGLGTYSFVVARKK